jgi:hypothetical protein
VAIVAGLLGGGLALSGCAADESAAAEPRLDPMASLRGEEPARPAGDADRPAGMTEPSSEAERRLALLDQAMRNSDEAMQAIESEDAGGPGRSTPAATTGRAVDLQAETPRVNLSNAYDIDEDEPTALGNRPRSTPSSIDATAALLGGAAGDADGGDGFDGRRDAASAPALRERARQQAEALARTLADHAEQSGGSPMGAIARVGALEIVRPGLVNEYFGALDSPEMAVALPPSDIAFVAAWRDLFARAGQTIDSSAGGGGGSGSGSGEGGGGVDLEALAATAREVSATLDDQLPLRITRAELCTRVEGFGVYRPIKRFGAEAGDAQRAADDGRYKFLAGRRHRVIVYVELERFRAAPTTKDGVAGYEVRLDQELELYHAGSPRVHADDDLLAWRTPTEPIADFSRRQRRDFFLVQVVDLPATLSVGSYRLKIRLTDTVSGDVAESVLPIDMVADVNAFGG